MCFSLGLDELLAHTDQRIDVFAECLRVGISEVVADVFEEVRSEVGQWGGPLCGNREEM